MCSCTHYTLKHVSAADECDAEQSVASTNLAPCRKIDDAMEDVLDKWFWSTAKHRKMRPLTG